MSVPEAERRESMHVVLTDGRVTSAGDAVVELLRVLPGTARLAGLAARLLPPVRRRIDREYRRLAARRDELAGRVDDVAPTVVRPRWVNLPAP